MASQKYLYLKRFFYTTIITGKIKMQRSIKIPDYLLEKLRQSSYNQLVEEVLSQYSEWISKNDTIFFREYTDHGISHLQNVLETSVSLMTAKSKKIFSDSDACLLIISTILHDIALHLQEDQFKCLVDKDSYCNYTKELDSETWHTLWTKFSAEASRFSQSQLHLFFGVNEPIPAPNISNPQSWTPPQYQLIGEFLRRHHPRLAHDFAIYGFPAVDNDINIFIKSDNSQFKKFIDLAGLVARSHGTSLRSLFEYLKNNFGHLRNQEGAHAIYVMAILRISDFLQLQPSRAPKGQLIIKNLRSPLSRKEWSIHAAIQNIIYDEHDDPESVEVIIDPETVNIDLFLRIQNLLNLIQKELDHSWAVLGEVFGRIKELNDLGLTIRRVRSNIDDEKKFGKKAGFVPLKATFTAADAELLKLFIKPLYGDKPEIAVRELVQNSVDAVRERLIYEPKAIENSVSVRVSIKKSDDGRWILRVEDRGIGMTLNTIINYFLNAGASFRLSTVWKEDFLDEKGKAKVLRSGRFGVGALAAFMLAEDPTQIEMKVITRHISSSVDGAYEFSTTLSDSPIQIKYTNKKEPGTTIDIYTSNPPSFMQESTKENASDSWDWYCLDSPIVERISLNGKRLPTAVSLPSSIEQSNYDYHWIFPKEYDSIGWTYAQNPSVVCNGIIVIGNEKSAKYFLDDGKFLNKDIKIDMPSISIFDKDGKLPITLDRLRIEYNQLQFLGDLRKDIEKNILAFLLITAPEKEINISRLDFRPVIKTHPAFKDFLKNIPWLYSDSGVIIYCPELLHISKARNIIELSELSLLPIVYSCLNKDAKKIGFAMEVISIWDNLENKSININGGTRLRIERQRVNEGKLYNIIERIDDNIVKRKSQMISQEKLDEYLINNFSGINIISSNSIFHLLEKTILKLNDNQFELQITFDELARRFYKNELTIIDIKQIFYKITTSKRELGYKHVRTIIDSFSPEINNDNTRRKNEELLYLIERDLENLFERSYEDFYHKFRDEFKRKIYQKKPEQFNTANLENILEEIKKLNNTPPAIEIERFGNSNNTLDWDKIPKLDFYKQSNNTPITEICLKSDFHYASSNNFLARIWLEYIGQNEICFNQKSKNDLIEEIQTKVDIKRHLIQWKSILAAEVGKIKEDSDFILIDSRVPF